MSGITVDASSARKILSRFGRNRRWRKVAASFGLDADMLKGKAEAFGRHLSDALLEPCGSRLEAVRKVSPQFAEPSLHPVADGVLRHYGVTAIDLAILCEAADSSIDFDLDDGTAIGFWHRQGEVEAVMSVHLSADAVWEHVDHGHTVEIFQPLPHTVVVGLGGRALKDVLSHPAIDPLDLVIESAEAYDKNHSTILNLAPLPTGDISGERP